MQKAYTLEKIEKEAEQLSPHEQLQLVEMLIHRLRKTGVGVNEGKPLEWSELYGLGEGLWKGENAQDYVNRLREDRT